MLSQIPNVSITIAKILMQKYETIFKLKEALELDNECLNNIKYSTSNGKERKISSFITILFKKSRIWFKSRCRKTKKIKFQQKIKKIILIKCSN